MKIAMLNKFVCGCVVALGVSVSGMQAAIIVVAPTATTPGSLQITEDIVFTITAEAGSSTKQFVFDDWVVSDGYTNFSYLSPNLNILVNGVSVSFPSGLRDNMNFSNGEVSPNDGFLNASLTAMALGDEVILLAGSYALSPIPNFNPMATQTFTGNIFLIMTGNIRISNIVAVPEPATVSALALGAIALVSRRRIGR